MKKTDNPSAACLILASASPRRRQLLRQAGVHIRVIPSRYCEGLPQGDPAHFARQAAAAKAYEVGQRVPQPAWVLAADTLVVCGKQIFGKPKSRLAARRMLQALSGREHLVLSGVSLQNQHLGKTITWVEKTRVRMREIKQQEVERYLNTGEWKDKAGAYGIQGRAGALVTKINGCYFNVVGLPLGAICARLIHLGIDL